MADIKGTGAPHDAASSSGDSNEKVMSKELDHPGMAAAVENIVGIAPTTDLVFTKQEEDRVWRKLDYRLLPLVFALYTLSVLDRSNLGNAKLAGLEDSIDLGGWRYNWLGTIFYIAYIFFQWTQMGWKRFPPHIYCAGAVLFWGFIASIQAAVFNWAGLMVCRFFLGIAEAMFGPGVPLYLSFFYPREKVGFRHGVFIAGSAMANAYGGALAYAITGINGTLAPWKILFLIEGLPTIVFALVPFFFLPDSLSVCTFLTDREKQIAAVAVARNQTADPDRKGGFQVKEMMQAFKEPKAYIPGIMYFSVNVSFASLPLFVPTIISEMGTYTSQQSNGLSAPPYLLCLFMIILLTWLSDRYKMRGPFVFLAAMVAAIGFIIQATASDTAPRYVGIFLAVQCFCCVALILAWTANIHGTESKRAGGMTILATVGQCGPLLGTNVFPESEKPYYRKGMWISAAFCLLIAFCSVALSLILIRENKQMEREGVIPSKEDAKNGLNQRDFDPSERVRYRYIW